MSNANTPAKFGKYNMIVSLEPSEFLPFGRKSLLHHPGLACLHLQDSLPCYRLDSSLVGSFSQVTMDEKTNDMWKLRVHQNIEEELYVSGHTAIWSKAGNVIKSFTLDSYISHALWTEYQVDGDNAYQPELKKPASLTEKESVEGVTLLADGFLHFYSRKNDDFQTALPFKVKQAWSFKYGLMLERCPDPDDGSTLNSCDNNQLTSVFCLQHPLREFAPVVTRFQGVVRYMNKPSVSVVFCDSEMIMTYDQKHSVHTVWRSRNISEEDSSYLQNCETQHQAATNSSLRHISISSPSFSPVRPNYVSSHGLPRTPLAKSLLFPSTPMSARSPSYQKTFSPASYLRGTPYQSPMSHESLFLNEPPNEASEPLRPELCLDHVWSERSSGMKDGNLHGKASKAFLTEDVCKQKYLAYLIESQRQLRLVKYGFSNNKSSWIFGSMTVINAKDAVPLNNCNFFAVLDVIGVISLYTGNVKMVKMHVSGIPMSMSYSHVLRNSAVPSTPQPISTPSHPSRPTSALGNIDEVGMLSPVPELTGSGVENISILTSDEFPFTAHMAPVNALPQSIGSSIILELSSGSYYKVDVPTFASSNLVENCMKALYYVLPNDLFTQFSIKWFALRHSPGSINSYLSEWGIFEACVREMIGYPNVKAQEKGHITQHSQFASDSALSPVVATKKARHTDHGNSMDWDQMLSSEVHQKFNWLFKSDDIQSNDSMSQIFDLQKSLRMVERNPSDQSIPLMSLIFPALHLVYEEQKLEVINWPNIQVMSSLLCSMAQNLGLGSFVKSYITDNPDLYDQFSNSEVADVPTSFKNMDFDPNIFSNIFNIMTMKKVKQPFPIIPGVTKYTEHILNLYDRLFKPEEDESSVCQLPPNVTRKSMMKDSTLMKDVKFEKEDAAKNVLSYMVAVGFTNDDLELIPHAIALPILQALHKCKEDLASNLPVEAFKLLGRHDLILQHNISKDDWHDQPLSRHTDPMRSSWQHQQTKQVNLSNEINLIEEVLGNEGESAVATFAEEQQQQNKRVDNVNSADDNVTRLLFPNDHRMSEVRRLLQADKPVKVNTVEEAGVSHEDFMEARAVRLYTLCNRTLSLPVGRGMLGLCSKHPVPTEPLEYPKIDVTGRGNPNNSTVDLSNCNMDLPHDWMSWPTFHSGCAFGLNIVPQDGDPWWINASKMKVNTNTLNNDTRSAHAGFLLGLGLNGNLKNLHTLEIHHYLTLTHTPTTVGLLLGIAATKCGTCDNATMRMLSLHIPALLPPHSTELEVPRLVQTAAAAAVGFLYMGSAKRLVVEVMLREIDRPPNAEGDTGSYREAYALSCGIALGLTVIGRGLGVSDLKDLNIPHQLYYYMTGKRKKLSHLNSLSSVMEGNQTNTDVTAPGAIIALSMMFLKTNNTSVAEWFTAPNTLLLLESIKPQHLTLRTTAHALVLWDSITPTNEWVESHIPEVIKEKVEQGTMDQTPEDDVDMETVVQCHASIISGACFGLGLRYAGSRNKQAYDTLLGYVNMFMAIWQNKGISNIYTVELLGRYLTESCMTTCLISLCMVVAGTGDLKCLQLCNYLHVTVGTEINYGMQMSVHMALGLLFLGKCRKSLCTTNKAIAALLVSFHPCFPLTTTDNQYHLQALRHFHVLAVEDRLLVPIDCTTKLPCYAQVSLQYESEDDEAVEYSMMAPCIIPDLDMLHMITVKDCRHWPVHINCKDEQQLLRCINIGLCVQRRAGYYPYIVDPKGHRRTIELSTNFQISEEISSNSPFLQSFMNIFNDGKSTCDKEVAAILIIQNLIEDLVKSEQTEQIFTLTGIMHMQYHLSKGKQPNPLFVWQMKIVNEYVKSSHGQNTVAAQFLSIVNKKLQKDFQRYIKETNEAIKVHKKTKEERQLNDGDHNDDIIKTISDDSFKLNKKIWDLIAYFLYYHIPLDLLHGIINGDFTASRASYKVLKQFTNSGIKPSVAVQLIKSLCS